MFLFSAHTPQDALHFYFLSSDAGALSDPQTFYRFVFLTFDCSTSSGSDTMLKTSLTTICL